MKRQFLIVLLAVLIGAIVGKYVYREQRLAVSPDSAPTLMPKPMSPNASEQILSRPIVDLSLNELEQSAALRAVADAAHANIAFLSDAGEPSENHRVTLHLRETTLRAALDDVLRLDPDGRTTYQMLDGVIFVNFYGSTVSSDKFARIYDVRDIITDYLRYELDPQLPNYDWTNGPPRQHYVEAVKRFVAMLQHELSQFKYIDSIEEVAGRLILVSDTDGHYNVERLLLTLRHVSMTHGKVEQMLVEPGSAGPRDDK